MAGMNWEQIIRRRMHGLYLSRRCEDIMELSRRLLGLHSWFFRNAAFSAVIRGAELTGWKTMLTKTWLYRGTLHGVAYDELPRLLALHPGDENFTNWFFGGKPEYKEIADEVLNLMEDGVNSRKELRMIFAGRYDHEILENAFSSWGGIFVNLSRLGLVSFRDMASRDFDLIDAAPTQSQDEVLPDVFHDFLSAYGPATLADAAWFLGFVRDEKKKLNGLDLDGYGKFQLDGSTFYYVENGEDTGDIPELTLLSGFDPFIVSYAERSAVLPVEYKRRVILKSGICLPTVAVNGRVEGIWNIKNKMPVLEFFSPQPERIKSAAGDLVDEMIWRTAGKL